MQKEVPNSLNLFQRLIFSLLPLFFLVGCSHGGLSIESLDQSLSDIQQIVVASLPVGKRAVSPNGREFFSDYFVIVESRARAADRLGARYYAHVYILGDRRPYVVEGVVRKEVRESSRTGPEYADAGVDTKLTQLLVKKLKANLSKSREDRNVIDDFRVF